MAGQDSPGIPWHPDLLPYKIPVCGLGFVVGGFRIWMEDLLPLSFQTRHVFTTGILYSGPGQDPLFRFHIRGIYHGRLFFFQTPEFIGPSSR